MKSKTASIHNKDKTGASGRCVTSKGFHFFFCIVNTNFEEKVEMSYNLALTA